MVVIRLARQGAKKRPFYHIVVSDKRRAVQGKFIEKLGYFNPLRTGADDRLSFKVERAQEWIAKGAQPSERVKQLLRQQLKALSAQPAA